MREETGMCARPTGPVRRCAARAAALLVAASLALLPAPGGAQTASEAEKAAEKYEQRQRELQAARERERQRAEESKLKAEEAAKQLEARRLELEAARAKGEALARDHETLAAERAALNEKLIATAARVQGSEAELSRIEERLMQYQEQEDILRASIEERHTAISKLLAAMQTMGREPPPAIVTQRADALKMVRSAMLMASIYPELKFQADSLGDDLKDLVRLGDGIRRERAAERAESEKLHEEQLRIAALIEEKKSLLALNKSQMAQMQAAAERHAREVTHLGELVERMTKELETAKVGLESYELELAKAREEERKAREQAKLLAQRPEAIEIKPSANQKLAMLSPGRIKPGIPFVEATGALPRPVQGEVALSFGDPEQHGGRSQGQWMRTRRNAQVISPADGWIVYAGEFRSYGQLLIIDAGGGYHILLAGMSRIDADVGQFVLASEPVGVMGSPAQNNGNQAEDSRPVLYIEFRKDGQPVNPAPWWAAIPEKVQG